MATWAQLGCRYLMQVVIGQPDHWHILHDKPAPLQHGPVIEKLCVLAI